MAKGGIFSALRYLGRTPARRAAHADGRPLRRPIGSWSDEVRTVARQRRGRRRQPLWPRVLGWVLVSMALTVAVTAEYPMVRATRGPISDAGPGCLLAIGSVTAVAPEGPVDAVPEQFTWWTDSAAAPFTLVVYDASFREVGRQSGIRGCSVQPAAELVSELERGGVFYWAVEYRVAAPAGAEPRPMVESTVASERPPATDPGAEVDAAATGRNGTQGAFSADPGRSGRVLRSAVTEVRIP